jgi:ribonucleoside-diphosphate reductase alpha chain
MAIWIENGMYYLRTKAAVDAIKFTLNNDKKAEPIEVKSVGCYCRSS